MSVSEVFASLSGRDAVRCTHLRQRHPRHDEALLVCAWPGCPEGTRNPVIQVPVGDDLGPPASTARFERETVPHGADARLSFRWRSAQ